MSRMIWSEESYNASAASHCYITGLSFIDGMHDICLVDGMITMTKAIL